MNNLENLLLIFKLIEINKYDNNKLNELYKQLYSNSFNSLNSDYFINKHKN
jgi:hypothetical protein